MGNELSIIKKMTHRYIVILCTLAILLTANFIAFRLIIASQEGAAAVVNVSGRQRMLTQQVAMYVHQIDDSEDIAVRQHHRGALLKTLNLMERSHKELIEAKAGTDDYRKLSTELRAMYFDRPLEVDKKIRSFISEARSVAEVSENEAISSGDPHAQRIFAAASGPLLEVIDAVVRQHQTESEYTIKQINMAVAAGTLLSLIVLVMSAFGVFRPLVRRVVAEMESQTDSKRRLRTILDSAGDGIVTVDKTGTITSFNRVAKKIFGYTNEEAIGQNVKMLMPEPHRTKHDSYLSDYLRTGEATIIGKGREVEAQRKDGTLFPLHIVVTETWIDEDVMFVAVVRDITERMRSEKATLKSTEQLRLLHSITEIANEASSVEAAVQTCLNEICAYTGWPVGHAYVLSSSASARLAPSNIWHLDNRRKYEDFRYLTENTEFEIGVGLPGRIMVIGKPAWIEDISDDLNFPRKKMAVESGLKSCFGLPVLRGEEVVAVLEFFSDKKVRTDESLMRDLTQVGTSLGRVFERKMHEDRLTKHQQQLEKMVDKRTGELSREVEKHKQTETALRESQQRLEAITENLNAGIIAVDKNGHIVFVNKAANKLLAGKTKVKFTGKEIDDVFLLKDGKKEIHFADSSIRQVMETGESFRNDDAVFVTSDKNTINVTFGCSPLIENGKCMGAIINFRDISTLKEAQNEALQASKLASVGQLAAGIAHEINTPTQYIGDNLRFLKDAFKDMFTALGSHQKLFQSTEGVNISGEQLKGIQETLEKADIEYLSEEVPAAIDQSLGGVAQVTQIVSAMKEFSHPGSREKKPTDLNQAIENTLTVCRNEWKHSSDLITNFDPELPLVPCYGDEVNQVLLNLIVNASHAIEEHSNEDKGQITIVTQRDGDWVEIRVSDTGGGIPVEIQDSIFDLFFTTKEVGKGTGQGLAICRDVVVKKHGGKLFFNSEEGKGTEFVIRLPIHPKSESKAA